MEISRAKLLYMAGDGGGGSRLEAKKNLPTPGTNFNPGPPLQQSASVSWLSAVRVRPAREVHVGGEVGRGFVRDVIGHAANGGRPQDRLRLRLD